MNEQNIILDTDSYKSSHFLQYPPGTTHLHAYLESRGGHFAYTRFFGLQYILKRYLTQRITKDTGAALMEWLNSGKADKTITPEQRDQLQELMAEAGVDVATFCIKRGLQSPLEVKESVFDETVLALNERIKKQKQAAAAVTEPEVH